MRARRELVGGWTLCEERARYRGGVCAVRARRPRERARALRERAGGGRGGGCGEMQILDKTGPLQTAMVAVALNLLNDSDGMEACSCFKAGLSGPE